MAKPEPEPKNQNVISLYCPDCNNKIPPEVLEDNNDPNVVCCPRCGVIIPIESQIENPEKTQENSEQSPQIKISQPSPKKTAKWHLKLLFYFTIHDLLYSKIRALTIVKRQEQLNSLTIKRYAKQLRSKLLKSPISRDLMTKLNPREQKKLKKVFHLFKEALIDEKQFKIYQIQAFIEGIQFIFNVMRGDYEFVTFSSTEKEIIMELKDKVNPFKDMRSKKSVGREITNIFARIIHQYLFALSRTNETITPKVVKELVDGVIDQLSAQDSVEWIESQINIKLNRRERYNFKVTRIRLNSDWIQREYFSDLLVSIVDAVQALMHDTTDEVAMSGLSRILLQGFEESELFAVDKAFNAREKLNLTIVLARMIHAHISAAFPPPRHANPNQKLPPALHRDINDIILEGLVDPLDINSDFLLRFYNFSLDKFHAARKKLLEKLEGDMIYRASFRTFLANLIENVFKITRQEPKESKLSSLELRIREDLKLYPYNWRNPNVKLFEDEKETEFIEPSNDLYPLTKLEEIPKKFERIHELIEVYPNPQEENNINHVDSNDEPNSEDIEKKQIFLKNVNWQEISDNWIIQVLGRGNITLNPHEECSKKNPLYMHKEWLEWVYTNEDLLLSDRALAKICGLKNHKSIRYWRKKHQIQTKEESGRYVPLEGYIDLYMPKEYKHPELNPLGDKRISRREHIIKMEKHLMKSLTPKELDLHPCLIKDDEGRFYINTGCPVHHINYKKQDNYIENLWIYKSNVEHNHTNIRSCLRGLIKLNQILFSKMDNKYYLNKEIDFRFLAREQIEKKIRPVTFFRYDSIDLVREEIKKMDWADMNWSINSKINKNITRKIILNPHIDCSEKNPLYRHKGWVKHLVSDSRFNLTDKRLAELCGISENTAFRWRWKIHNIHVKRIGFKRSLHKVKNRRQVWLKVSKDYDSPFTIKFVRFNFILEHRFILEQELIQRSKEYHDYLINDKYLKPECRVHHINLDSLDNRIENLHPCRNRSDHKKIHSSLYALIDDLLKDRFIIFEDGKYLLNY